MLHKIVKLIQIQKLKKKIINKIQLKVITSDYINNVEFSSGAE